LSVFDGTAGFYRQYRPGIPQSVADMLDAAAPARSPRRLLDIGTGTGLVVEALLGHFDDFIAIDNDAAMLAAAEGALRAKLPDGAKLLLREVTAEAFTPPPGWQADLVTICRSFPCSQPRHERAPACGPGDRREPRLGSGDRPRSGHQGDACRARRQGRGRRHHGSRRADGERTACIGAPAGSH
jgi:SAM-dependent methyltransferase